MKVLLLLYGDAEAEEAMGADKRRAVVDEHIRFGRLLDERRAMVIGEALEDASTARTIRFPAGGAAPYVTDGPYLETKEALGGFYLLNAGRSTRRSSSRSRFPAHRASLPSCASSPGCSSRDAMSVRYRPPSIETVATPR